MYCATSSASLIDVVITVHFSNGLNLLEIFYCNRKPYKNEINKQKKKDKYMK